MLQRNSRSAPKPASATYVEAREIAYRFLSRALSFAGTDRESLSRCCYPYLDGSTLNGKTAAVLDAARGGNPVAHETVCAIAADLTSRGEHLPLPLQQYMTKDAPAFRRPRGRPRGSDWVKGAAIARAVDALVELTDLNKTTNRSSRSDGTRPSACSIVAEVLKERFGVSKTEAAVEKISEEYFTLGRLLPLLCDERFNCAILNVGVESAIFLVSKK
jgi:hypothetical protein